MNNKYKIGDLVRILNNWEFSTPYQKQCPNGSIVEVEHISYGALSVKINEDGETQWASVCNVEPINNAIPIPKQTKKSKKQVIENTIRHIIVGNKTIVLSRDSNGKTMKGEAICHKTDDVFDVYEGFRVSTCRMFGINPFPRSEIYSNKINNTISDDTFNYIVNEGIVVVCETKEEANDYLKYLHSKDYKWNNWSTSSLLGKDNGFDSYVGDVCYYLEEGKEVSYSGMGYAKGGDYITKKYKELVNKPSIHQLETLSAYSTEELLDEIKSRTK